MNTGCRIWRLDSSIFRDCLLLLHFGRQFWHLALFAAHLLCAPDDRVVFFSKVAAYGPLGRFSTFAGESVNGLNGRIGIVMTVRFGLSGALAENSPTRLFDNLGNETRPGR